MPSTSKAAKTATEPEPIPAVSPTGDTQQLETLKAQLAESQSQVQALTSDKELLELKTKFFQLQVSAHEKLTAREITRRFTLIFLVMKLLKRSIKCQLMTSKLSLG